MARRNFRRIFAAENRQTGDGRVMSPGSMRWETDPQVLRFMPSDEGFGHAGAVPAATITGWERDADGNLWAIGFADDAIPAAAHMMALLDAGVPLGVSVDLDDVTVEIVDTAVTVDEVLPPGEIDMENTGRVRGLVHYDHVTLTLGSSPLRRHRSTDVQAAANEPDPGGQVWYQFSLDEILERFTDGRIRGATICDLPAFDFARMGFDSDAPAEDAGSETDAAPSDDTEEPEAVAASAGRRQARERIRQVRATQSGHNDRQGVTPALFAGFHTRQGYTGLADPPAAWFNMPEPSARTPLTVTDDGQVFGHMWSWSDCHTGSSDGQCILAPHSSPGLPWFHTGYLITDDGSHIPVGALTIGGGHADDQGNAVAAREHYDNVATVWADVRVIEGRHGGWACGATRPGLSAEQLRAIRASVPSGDWRGVGGRSELLGIHQVVHPGFPTARVDRHGEPLAIVAAGAFQAPATASVLTACDVARTVEAAVAPLRAELSATARARLREVGTATARDRLRTRR